MDDTPRNTAPHGPLILGPLAAKKLCAVEGVAFAPDADDRNDVYIRLGLTPAQRREAIIKHYKAIA